MRRTLARKHRDLGTLGAAIAVLLALGGCDIKHPTANLIHGKQLFVQKCGSCHMLNHAGTTGVLGPNLDAAFRQDRADNLRGSDIRGLVTYWIQYPNVYGVMPAKLFTGQAAEDVAGYVSEVAAKPGQDTGALATAVPSTSQKKATEKSGTLEIDADPTGQLKFLASSGTATAGSVTLRMKNASSVPHDIAIRGSGLSQIGKIVSGGGISTVTSTLAPGSYTFYCSVPGHEQAGMKGTITVK